MTRHIVFATLLAVGLSATVSFAADKESKVPAPLDFKMTSLEGKEVNLADYQGKVVLMVNVASKCGATPQYAALESLHEVFADKGLVVVGFPCNQFGKQEPGSAAEIREFCSSTYDVKFPMFSKIDVNGEEAAPLYKYLTSEESGHPGKIRWNFEKFLVDRSGKVVARFATSVAPDSDEVVAAIKAALAEK
ncbi:MAG: glutathione peroxidase [Planctomycetaceae bacterium]|nr:glutathione peroxidase [Planctomycetaceae bacterium]MCA9031141.1 glutathione peroxidase [Planctomycetaceae bacterium]MCB9952074.1 glutathione peroxidase [Planctomycetaceae bacterium]